MCVSRWVVGFMRVCGSRAEWESLPPHTHLVSASAVSLTRPTANQNTASKEEKMMGEAMLEMVLARSDGCRRLCVHMHVFVCAKHTEIHRHNSSLC